MPADGREAADGQQAQLDDTAGLRRGSNDSSGEQVAGIPQLAALAQRRSAAGQRSMQSLDDLSWARRSGQVRLKVQPTYHRPAATSTLV